MCRLSSGRGRAAAAHAGRLRKYAKELLLVSALLGHGAFGVGFPQNAAAQSRIEKGPQYTFLVTSTATGSQRTPFLPLGWWDLGVCTPPGQLDATNDAALLSHLDSLALYGSNLVLMQDAADGRLVARRHWRNYPASRQTWFDVDGDGTGDYQRGFGHPDPQFYVERLRWFMDRAVARGIFTLIGVGRFIVPLPESTWKESLALIVDGLKDHPGLFGWYLFDEPEVNVKGAIFGNRQSAYSGPTCQPQPDGTRVCQATTDLLREAYRVIKQHDADHIVAVSLNDPQHFYSPGRFDWAYTWTGLNGPFDLDPTGRMSLPTDVVGVNLNPFVREPPRQFYRDPNAVSRAMKMVHEAVQRDGGWGSIYLSAQAQVSSSDGQLPCRAGDNDPFRPLRDRDILWQMITPFVDGARGLLHYAHSLTPEPGTGTSELALTQRERIHRAARQFREAGLDSVLLRYPALPDGGEWGIERIFVRELTDDYLYPFAGGSDSGSGRRLEAWETPAAYVRSRYNRGADGTSARITRPGISMADFRHIRSLVVRVSDTIHLVLLSNVYDARVDVVMGLGRIGTGGAQDRGAGDAQVDRATFDLSRDGNFAWLPAQEVVGVGDFGDWYTRLIIPMEPYSIEIYRVEHRRER